MTDQQPILQVIGLSKRYDAIQVTDNVNLDVMPGEIHALIGPNGAGKTTLIGQIAGELACDSGRIEFLTQAVNTWSVSKRARAGMARSYQINSTVLDFTALENVMLAVQARQRHSFHFLRPALQETRLVVQACESLDRVGMLEHRDVVVGHLSYGQQRLIEVATALATQPRLLLLDEPMAGLGPSETQRMIALFDSLRADCSMLLVEHDMSAVFALADRISVLVYGQVLLTDTPARVKSDATVRQAYLGQEELA